MTRQQQYRFLIAAGLAVAWIAAAVYAALAALEAGQSPVTDQPAWIQTIFLPYTLARGFGLPMRSAFGLAGGLLALVVLWIVFTVALWALLELAAFLSGRLRS